MAYKRGQSVYSSGPGGASSARTASCPRCAASPCRCNAVVARPPDKHDLRVQHERSGRKGKVVTVAKPLYLTRADAQALLAALKKRCGCGGTLVDTTDRGGTAAYAIELQGEQADTVLAELAARGYRGKRAGGR